MEESFCTAGIGHILSVKQCGCHLAWSSVDVAISSHEVSRVLQQFVFSLQLNTPVMLTHSDRCLQQTWLDYSEYSDSEVA